MGRYRWTTFVRFYCRSDRYVYVGLVILYSNYGRCHNFVRMDGHHCSAFTTKGTSISQAMIELSSHNVGTPYMVDRSAILINSRTEKGKYVFFFQIMPNSK